MDEEGNEEIENSLLDKPKTQRPPKDRYHLVYIIFYILGVASLLPWNFFSNAKQYFLYKLRNTSRDDEGDASWTNASYFTHSQVMFENYLEIAALVPAVFFMFANMAATKYISVQVRVTCAMCLMIIMFTLTVILTMVSTTDHWQHGFLILSLVTIVLMNAGSAVLQGAVCGLAGLFPEKYMQAVMGGMGMGGLIAAAANILTTSVASSPVSSGFGYFLTAELVTVLGLFGFLLLHRLEYVKYHVLDRRREAACMNHEADDLVPSSLDECYVHSSSDSLLPSSDSQSSSAIVSVLKLIWIEGGCVMITFLITLSCYPALHSAIQSTLTTKSLWTSVYFTLVVCFLLFNVTDFTGRTISSWFHWPATSSRLILTLLCVLRAVFIPLFLLCNIQPRYGHIPVLLANDVAPIILVCLFGLTNGYLATNCMMAAPMRVSERDVETAGSMMGFFMSLGLGLGALLSIGLIKSV